MTDSSNTITAATAAPASNMRWYVVHAYSGMEKAVERNLRERIDLDADVAQLLLERLRGVLLLAQAAVELLHRLLELVRRLDDLRRQLGVVGLEARHLCPQRSLQDQERSRGEKRRRQWGEKGVRTRKEEGRVGW